MERYNKNWNSYLCNETNKIELSRMIAQPNFDESKFVAASKGALPGADRGWGGGGWGGAPSMHFTSASSKSDVSKYDTRTRSDFWPLLRLPWFDKDGGTSVFSTSNKVSPVLSLTCSDM